MGDPSLDDWSHATEGQPHKNWRKLILKLIYDEVERSYRLHGCPRWGRHEAYAIILEELDEVKQAVFDDLPFEDLMKELVQTAAMCVRYLETEPRFEKELSLRDDNPS